MILPGAIHIWEQHAGQPPVCHAVTDDLDAVADIIRAWASQFCRQPVVAQHSGDDLLITDVSGMDPAPLATLWAEYPDHLLAGMVSPKLDARWRGPALGERWDTRDVAVRRRISR